MVCRVSISKIHWNLCEIHRLKQFSQRNHQHQHHHHQHDDCDDDDDDDKNQLNQITVCLIKMVRKMMCCPFVLAPECVSSPLQCLLSGFTIYNFHSAHIFKYLKIHNFPELVYFCYFFFVSFSNTRSLSLIYICWYFFTHTTENKQTNKLIAYFPMVLRIYV